MARITKRSRDFPVIFCIAVAILIHVFTVQVACAGDKVFMWKVASPKATAYILGTVHMMKKEMYPLDPRIENAFGRSDTYALEFNIDDVTRMQMDTMLSDIGYGGEDTIRNHVSPDTYDLIQKKFTDYGLPIEYMSKFRPWFLAVMIETLEYQKLGLDPRYGVDKYFLQKAEGRKPIVELESFDSQLDLFRNMPEKDQELFLLYTMKDADDSGRNLDVIMKAWADGDARTMERLIFDPLKEDRKLARIYDKMFFERNRNMTGKIVKMLSQKGTYFVAVGAGHLVGSQGIIDMLSHKGYSVTQQ